MTWTRRQRAFQNNLAPPDKTRGMHRCASLRTGEQLSPVSPQFRLHAQTNRAAE